MKASTTTRGPGAAPVNGAATAPPPTVRTPLPTRQRRTGYAALGAVPVIGLGAAFGYLYGRMIGMLGTFRVALPVPVERHHHR